MKIHTDNLIGPALDWAVELAKGTHWSDNGYFIFNNPKRYDKNPEWKYSTDWSVGGPIIEREKLGVWYSQALEDEQGFEARTESFYAEDKDANYVCLGPTPLVAAMRCYVTSKLGNKIEIPEELK